MIFSLRHYGKSAMQRLFDLGVLGTDFSCAHFVWASDIDISILADVGAVAVNNPGSNLRLHTGICRAADVIAGGGNLAFGTDSISFSDDEDFFEELRLASYLQRKPGSIEEGRLPSLELLASAALNGAQAIRQEDRIGSLEVGKEADLLVLSRSRLEWPAGRYARTPIADLIVDRGSKADLEHVMVAGRLVMRAGVITTVNENDVRESYAELVRRRSSDLASIDESVRLAMEVDPYVLDFYRDWPEVPLAPASVYNVKNAPDIKGHK
jgi:cytosine/adenosine deaminase-related metal-dependent hydrolase